MQCPVMCWGKLDPHVMAWLWWHNHLERDFAQTLFTPEFASYITATNKENEAVHSLHKAHFTVLGICVMLDNPVARPEWTRKLMDKKCGMLSTSQFSLLLLHFLQKGKNLIPGQQVTLLPPDSEAYKAWPAELQNMLAHLDLCHKRVVVDQDVQATSVLEKWLKDHDALEHAFGKLSDVACLKSAHDPDYSPSESSDESSSGDDDGKKTVKAGGGSASQSKQQEGQGGGSVGGVSAPGGEEKPKEKKKRGDKKDGADTRYVSTCVCDACSLAHAKIC